MKFIDIHMHVKFIFHKNNLVPMLKNNEIEKIQHINGNYKNYTSMNI